uniref:Polyketide synthase n=1 Tax=Pestalotiopsis microspora TaxID=85828 RepID=A0A1P8NTL5_PESMI|nr:polyketide synthase [Pestalotiopsis microspora]
MTFNTGDLQGSTVAHHSGDYLEASDTTLDESHTNPHLNGAINGDSRTETTYEPIAICGMACRLPGGISSPQELWEFLISKRDAKSKVPSSRYNVDAYYSPVDKPGAVKTPYGYFLDGDLSRFDSSFFSMSPMELERCDPQQRLLLEVAHECTEDAGEVNYRSRPIGVYIGNFGEDWNDMLEKEPQQYGVYRLAGSGDFALANRLSYEMNLQGPSMTIRTACSASLTGLNEACLAISRGDCESAIVGGVSVILTPSTTIKLSEQGVLSPDGSCKSFSADANGYARAEAANAVFIKSLKAAIRDGNPIRAVIRGTAVNSDGKTPGMSYPGVDSQETLIRRAYQIAGLKDYSKTAFVECHGTGTLVGDPIETTAVARVFGSAGVYIGSVKPNVGHSEGASGLTSVIKAVLALEHRTIPPNIKFSSPNPNIPFESARLQVPIESTPWPVSKEERVSVNSFGIGGANAHVILDSAASHGISIELEEAADKPQLLLYSSKSQASLKEIIHNYESYMIKHPERMEDLAYTLVNKREHLPYRAFVVASRDQPGNPSPPAKPTATGNLVMVFTGQGAQWPQMGRDLLRNSPVFRASIKTLDQHLKAIKDAPPSWNIETELRKPAKSSRLHEAELSQPLCTAIQIALVDALAAVGIVPVAVVGHSSGEIAGAYAAGALSAEEAITASFYRGVVAKQQTRAGAMAAIGLSWKDTKPFLVAGVGIACENSPKSVTISGDADKVQAVVAHIQESAPNVLARLLKVDKAYHSYHMAEVGPAYYQLVGGANKSGRPPHKLFFSSVTGGLLTEREHLDARYFQRNLESPVLFNTAIKSILNHSIGQNAIFLEIGPHSALAGPIRQTLSEASKSAPYISTMLRGQSGTETLLSSIGNLYTLHVPLDLRALKPEGNCLADLPRYPWARSAQYWHETRVSKEWRQRKFRHHNLLGVRVLESSDIEPVWRNLLHLDNAPWIRDHKVSDEVVFPFAAYVSIAGEAVRQSTGIESGFKVQNMSVSAALVLKEGAPVELVTSLRPSTIGSPSANQWYSFTVSSHNGQTWVKHCTGEVCALNEARNSPPAAIPDLPRLLDQRRWHEATVRRGGLNFGPSFRRWDSVRASTVGDRLATGIIKKMELGDEDSHHIHPSIIDSALQLLVVAAGRGLSLNFRTNLAVGVGSMSIYRCTESLTASVQAEPHVSGMGGHGVCISGNSTVLEMSDVKLVKLEDPEAEDPHAAGRLVWKPSVDFLPAHTLFSREHDLSKITAQLERLFDLCIRYSRRALAGIDINTPLNGYFRDWILAEATDSALQQPNSGEKISEVVFGQIEDEVKRLSNTPAADQAQAMLLICTSLEDIIHGRKDISTLEEDEVIQKTRTYTEGSDPTAFIRSLAHSKPNLAVLDLRVNAQSNARTTLQELGKLYSVYTIASTSADHLAKAKESLQGFERLEFMTLNVEQNLEDQGFTDRKYDLVITTNFQGQTSSLSGGLHGILGLLKSNGRLLLDEILPSAKWINYVLGVFPYWWSRSYDRKHALKPRLSLSEWESELLAAGFGKPEVVLHETEASEALAATIVVKAARHVSAPRRITLLHAGSIENVDILSRALQARGYEVDLCALGGDIPTDQDIVSLLDQADSFFKNLDGDTFKQLQTVVARLNPGRSIFWITPVISTQCRDPGYASVLGFARVLRSEVGLDFAVCQTDKDVAAGDDSVLAVLDKFLRRDRSDDFRAEAEYMVLDGVVHVGRFYPFVLADATLVSSPEDRVVLYPGKHGQLREPSWRYSPRESLAPDAVEIEVYSAGLTERDTTISTTANASPNSGPRFGLVGGGVVRQAGETVKNFKAGDTVIFWHSGALASVKAVPEELCARIPFELDLDEAIKIVYSYVLAFYALYNIGGLERHQSVLIHGAPGLVGFAALDTALTNGSATYLVSISKDGVRSTNLPPNMSPENISSSEEGSVIEDILRKTAGRGVDLVLDLYPGKSFDPENRCLAPFGRRLSFASGHRGTSTSSVCAYDLNRTFHSIDVEHIVAEQPDKIHRLMQSVLARFRKGSISHIEFTDMARIVSSSAAAITDAFQQIREGFNGELSLVKLRQSEGTLSLTRQEIALRRIEPVFDSGASYLLIGGLGGLGRSISLWMVELGARHLIYLSRSAGSRPEDGKFVRELESMGCEATLVQGDVTKTVDVQRAVEAAKYPLKGVMQMSIVLRDIALRDMSWDDWESAVSPKVEGTWALHNAVVNAGLCLDFLILFSAISGLIGQPGQANYASANTFLDAFCQYRRDLGQPASVVQIGPVEDVGVIANDASLLSQLRSSGLHLLREQEVIDAIALAILSSSPEPPNSKMDQASGVADMSSFVLGLRSTLPLKSAENRCVWRWDPRMASYHNGTSAGSGGKTASNELGDFLAAARTDAELLKTSAAAQLLATEIGHKVLELLIKPEEDLNLQIGLTSMGLDSLVAIEVRTWWKQAFGLDVTVLELLSVGTLEMLGRHAAKRILEAWHS